MYIILQCAEGVLCFLKKSKDFIGPFSHRTDRRRRYAPRRQNPQCSVSFRMKKQHPRQHYHANWWPSGQSRSVKSALIYWKLKFLLAVTLGQNSALWLPGWFWGQLLAVKWPFIDWRLESSLNKPYSHRTSNSIKVTASSLQIQVAY